MAEGGSLSARRPDPTPAGTDPSVGPLTAAAIVGVAIFILVLLTFHFIQPELDPLHRFGSEYARGRMGWLLRVGFFAFAAGIVALALALDRELAPATRSRVGIVLIAISSLGFFFSGVFPADLQVVREGRWTFNPSQTFSGIAHDVAGFFGFLTMLPGMILVTRAMSRADRLDGGHRWLRALAWLSVLLFLAMLFFFGPRGLNGLGQRLFLAAWFAWLLMTARGLRRGAFRPARA